MSTQRLRFGLRMPAAGPVRDVVAAAQKAERAGFDACWFPDSHLNYREVWVTLSAATMATDRVQLGPTVTNLATRHVTVTASAARALAEMAPGRFLLGLGAGDSALGFDDLRHATVAQMRTGVSRLRALMAGEGVRFGDFEARLRDASVSPPIYVAGSGPKTLAMAGAVADAVIVMMGNLEEKLGHVRRGAAEAGRATPPVHVYTMAALVDDVEKASRRLKPACVRAAELEGIEIFEKAGVRVDRAALRDHKMGAVGDLGHLAHRSDAPDMIDRWVSDEAALWYAQDRTMMGSEADIRAHWDRFRRLGIAGVTMTQMQASAVPDAIIDTIGPLMRSYSGAV